MGREKGGWGEEEGEGGHVGGKRREEGCFPVFFFFQPIFPVLLLFIIFFFFHFVFRPIGSYSLLKILRFDLEESWKYYPYIENFIL